MRRAVGATHDCALPIRIDYILLDSAFGVDPRIRFSRRIDEVAAAIGIKDHIYALVPALGPVAPAAAEATQRPGPARPERGGGPSTSSSAPASPSDRCFWLRAKVAASPSACAEVPRDEDAERDQGLHAGAWDKQQSANGGDDGAEGTARFHAATAAPTFWDGAVKRCGGGGGGGGDYSVLVASAGRALAATAHKAACREPCFDVIKLRFKLGKSLFRNLGPRAGKTELSIADLEGATGCGGRGAYQSVFSNYVPASAVPRVTSWLTGVLGFCLVASKTSATLHVINQELNVHYGIALAMGAAGDDSSASLRKVKVGGGKSHSVALLAAPHQMDLRLRLITQFREHPCLSYSADAHSTARRMAAAVRTEGFEGFLRSKRGLPRNRHLEYGRRKTKLVYEGRFPAPSPSLHHHHHQGGGCCGGQLLRVTVTHVQDDQGSHWEISGCLPEVNAALSRTVSQHQHQQQQQPTAHPSAAEPPACFVPEWRRGRATGSCGNASPQAPGVGGFVPEWRRGRSRGDDSTCLNAPRDFVPEWRRGRIHDSASSSPACTPLRGATPSPPHSPARARDATSDPDAGWAVGALATLAGFVSELNKQIEDLVLEPQLPSGERVTPPC
ncbi:hypothetical protein PLESTB_000571800 [Pleodorina starrii]|uniref:Uncharacterized protein n=1 Tax=Pleodorina starrii TaxID=330485 RepID=A0A9W6F0N2_9CHLO|nr:hypothetical protein PLESTB_000571800 [Pleodorina starrii]